MTRVPEPQIARYQRWLRETRGLAFASYDALWRWSTTDLDAFWRSLWDYYAVQSPTPFEAALVEDRMPGAVWFRGAQVNVVQQVLRHADAAHAAGHPALVFADEALLAAGALLELTWPELRRQVGTLAAQLQAMGVQRGDCVVAYLPNIPQTIVCFLAAGGALAVGVPRLPMGGRPGALHARESDRSGGLHADGTAVGLGEGDVAGDALARPHTGAADLRGRSRPIERVLAGAAGRPRPVAGFAGFRRR